MERIRLRSDGACILQRDCATFGKMTAHDQMRAMLDQLMGTGRNGTYSSPHVIYFGDGGMAEIFARI